MMNITPSLRDFLKHSKKNNLIVFSSKFYCDYLTPVSIYYSIRKLVKKESFLLESVEGQEKISRFSFIGAGALVTFKSRENRIYIRKGTKSTRFNTKKDPLGELKILMSQFSLWPKEHIRFFGGFVGYMGYDVIHFYEPVGGKLVDDIGSADSYFILPEFLIIFDHIKKQIEILSFLLLEGRENPGLLYRRQKSSVKKLIKAVLVPSKLEPLNMFPSGFWEKGIKSDRKIKAVAHFKKKDFINSVKKAKRYITNGEIIQVVLSQRFSIEFRDDPFLAYRYLRIINPSPYMYYLSFGDVKIAGSSPEMLLRCEDNRLITRPIAGTRKRGHNEEEDKALADELMSDEKERAEHVMLVDLGRNDLGRTAKRGTVEVPIFMSIEKFSHVMHIVSEVRASLDEKNDIFSALKGCFPAGTVSGAPKVRAMQIINELEPVARGIYAGCIGYFSFTNSLDTCIIIRTVIFKNGRAYVQAGAGIVADSSPSKEYKEIVNKAGAQMLALKLALFNKNK